MTTISQQFLQVKNGYKCSICDHLYKKIQTKKGNYTKNVRKHFKKNCIKKITRNLKKCYDNEKSVKILFQKLKGKIIELPHLKGEYLVLDILKNKKERKYSKNEPMVKLKNIKTNKEITIGIQVKSYNFGTYENWPSYNHLHKIKNNVGVVLLESLLDSYKIYQNTFEKYKNRKGKNNTKFVKFALTISNNNKNNYKQEVLDYNLKEDFIKRIDNPVDYFYYYQQKDKFDTFNIDSLKIIQKKDIQLMKMYYNFRSIYTSSGNTQLNQSNIFDFLTEEEKLEIPKIIMKEKTKKEIELFLKSMIKKYK